jgi:hypothetical protein
MGMNPRLLRPTASGFDPRRISGLQLWMHAEDAVLSGTNVTSWPDRSKRGFSATVTSGTPTFGATAINNRPAVKFDGSSSLRINANVFTVGLSSTVSIFAAVRPTAAVGTAVESRRHINLGGDGSGRFGTLLSLRPFQGSQNWAAIAERQAVSAVNATSSVAVTQVRKIHGLTYDANTIRHYLNNSMNASVANVPTSQSGATDSLGTIAFGAQVVGSTASFPAVIDIAEVVVYSKVLSDAERNRLYDYFVSRYSPE